MGEREIMITCSVRSGTAVARRFRTQDHYDLIAWAVLFAFGVYFVQHHELHKAVLFFSVSFLIPSWFLAIRLPTKCGVTTVRGRPCQNRATGVIFGCKQLHRWDKVFARRRIASQHRGSSRPRENRLDASAGEVVTVRVEADMKSNITFYMAMLTGVCTVVTTTGFLLS